MATARNIAKNTGFILATSLVQKALTLLLIVYIARQLGVAEFGLYSFVFSFVAIFGIIANFGLETLNFRDISQNTKNAERILSVSLGLKIILSIISIVLVFVSINLLKYDSFTVSLVMLASFSMVLDTIAATFRTVFVAFQRMELEFIANTISKGFLVIAGFAVLFMGKGVLWLVLVTIASSLINLLLSAYWFFTKFAKPKILFDKTEWKAMLLAAWPFCFMGIFSIIYAKIDIIMLSSMQGSHAVGLYDSAVRLVESLALIITAFSTAIFPVMNQFFAQKNQSVPLILEKSVKFVSLIILPIAFGTTLLASEIISFIYGGEFFGAGIALQILIWYLALNFVAVVFQLQLNSMNKEILVSKIVAGSVLLNIAMNIFLIPAYSFTGAAIATLVSQFLLTVTLYYFIKKDFRETHILKATVKSFVASAIMSTAILFLPLRLLLVVPIAAIIYGIAFVAIKGFSETDIQLLKKAVKIK